MRADGTVGLYVDMASWVAPPTVDSFVCTIGSKGIGSLYHVAEVYQVKRKKPTRVVRYQLRVYKANDLKAKLTYNEVSGRVFLEGCSVLTITWYKR